MLHVDPVKRLTIADIMNHPFFLPELPRYLSPLPPPPGPVIGMLTSLVAPQKQLDFEVIDGLGRMDESIVNELAERLEGVDREEVWEALRREDGPQGNAVKVAYLLLRDKRRKGRDRESGAHLCTLGLSDSDRRPGTRGTAGCFGWMRVRLPPSRGPPCARGRTGHRAVEVKKPTLGARLRRPAQRLARCTLPPARTSLKLHKAVWTSSAQRFGGEKHRRGVQGGGSAEAQTLRKDT